MSEYINGCCSVCRKDTEVRHKKLYIHGSEGIWLCIKCELKVVDFIREEMRKITLELLNNKKIGN